MYDFDCLTDRNTPDDIKYTKIDGIDDLIPMWVADMDFKCPPEVSDELVRVASTGLYGYSEADDAYDEAVINWFGKRFDWSITSDQILKLPGVVLAISYAVRVLTDPDDHVMIFEPVYGPFRRCVEGNGRKLTIESLKNNDGHYEVDFEDMEKRIIEDKVRILVWCSPHNPGGRVWTKEELQKVSEICKSHNVFIVSDEIHSDLILYGNSHIPMAKIAGDNCVVLTAPTKTFNIAGIQAANIISSNKEILRKIKREAYVTGAFGLNKMGIAATKAAYNYGEKWLTELLSYIEGNMELLRKELEGTKLVMMKPEGTYLAWIDCSAYEDFANKLLKEAHIRVSEGTDFGKGGEGFIRLNVACPRSVLAEALERIKTIM
ncbi:MalY/PatB family protein [Butyrivibrio sp. WCE2006]|uniref:MalY/PatB family protein n=1 Tax=Butyrivibrio sp. WCE2006 TaxID=1410611 RepID=UPI0005D26BD9|nr:MalY/PatB family protein [Butyrivibrio sp. WCE2006]